MTWFYRNENLVAPQVLWKLLANNLRDMIRDEK
ncbi:MAG: hypothetical protein JWP37_358 [Mucilaginibacter sp.]|nr:hypothetical protein [Mucilaginibacter sp.]